MKGCFLETGLLLKGEVIVFLLFLGRVKGFIVRLIVLPPTSLALDAPVPLLQWLLYESRRGGDFWERQVIWNRPSTRAMDRVSMLPWSLVG
jgi:hypothetical protein